MSIVALSETPILSFLNNAGQLNAGGTLLTQVGGVNYPTYQDPNGSTPLPNPIPLNSRGEISNAAGTSCQLFLVSGVTYDFTLFDVNGNQLWTASNVMAIAPVAVGNMTDEKGSGGQVGFVAGVDFTAGTSNTLTLSQNYGSASNLWVAFDAGEQGGDTFSLSGANNETLTFNAPIPLGTQKVYVKGGTSLTVGTPGIGTITDVNVAANANIDSSKLSFLQAGAGAVRRTVQSKERDIVSVMDFGAKGDGTTDDTAAMQAAHNTGKLIYYPANTYKFSTLTIPAGGVIGDGPSLTILTSTDTTGGDTISLTAEGQLPSPGAYLFRDFQLVSSAGKTAGNGMNVNPATFENQGSFFDNVWFYDHPTALMFTSASLWTINNCKFLNYRTTGVYVNNNNVADSGDSSISGGTEFNTGTTTAVAVFQAASGGLKINNFKMNGGAYGYLLALNSNGSTGDLIIGNGSIENMATAAIALSRSAGTNTFTNVSIDNLQIAICLNGIVADNSGFISNLTIGSGVIISLAPGNGSGVNFSSVSNFSVAPIVIIGTGGSPDGLAFGAGCTNGRYGLPITTNITTPVSNSAVGVLRDDGLQIGALNVTTSTAEGSNYLGSTPVVFPVGYKATPIVHCYPNSAANGAVSAFASGISTTGFTLNVIGTTNGGSVGVSWDSTGQI